MANNRRRTKSVASHSSVETVDDLKAANVQLRFELETERKCIRRLRREKANEVQLAREQEQNRAAISLKELAAKLQQEKEQEIDTLRFKHKADIVKVVKQKDKEVNKIKKDLGRCQDDLKEEVFKCGLSTSARVSFELERSKLLQEIKELNACKKQVEDALHASTEAEKQRTQELRQLQETSRNEVAKLNRQANIEVKRLLEQLKAKENLLLTTRGSSSAARPSPSIKRQPDNYSSSVGELVSLSKEIETWKKKLLVIEEVAELLKSGGSLQNLCLQRKLYEIEKQLRLVLCASKGFTEKNDELVGINKTLEQKVSALEEQNDALNMEIKSANDEARRLKDLMSSTGLSSSDTFQYGSCRYILKNSSQAKSGIEKKKPKVKKTVRFLLPNEEHEIFAGSDGSWHDDGGGGGMEGEVKHQVLQSYSVATNSVNSNKEEWKIQKESLEVVIKALEEKLHLCEDNEDKLKLKLKEVCDHNEELEFQILELENGTDERKLQWQKENEILRSELSKLRNQMSHSDITERNVAIQCSEELLAREISRLSNPFHKMTDEFKISAEKIETCQNETVGQCLLKISKSSALETVDAKSVKCSDACNRPMVSNSDGRKESESLSQIESLKRKLSRSQVREQEMKDQLLLLEEEKNRHIRLLQQQLESLESQDDCSSASDLQLSDRTTDLQMPQVQVYEGEPGSHWKRLEMRGNIIKLKLDTTLNWIASPSDVESLTPLSGNINICPKFEYQDLREELLNQQVSDLERDRDVLQEMVHSNESTIDELQMKIHKLQQSEKDLQQIVIRLENAEEKLRFKADDMEYQNYDMEKQLLELKDSETMLLQELKKMKLIDCEQRMRMEELVEEKYCCENAWKRRLSEGEMEKKLVLGKTKELEDQIADLEGTEILLRQKVKKMEKSESFLRNELEDARREINTSACQISDLEIEKQFLLQKLEKLNMDFTAQLLYLKQEKEAMNVEMIEMNCTIKVLKQCLASRDATILSLESKLHELELCEKELWRHIQQQFDLTNYEHEIQVNQHQSNELQHASGCVYHNNTYKDCCCRDLENESSAVNDLEDDLSKDSVSMASVMSSSMNPADDVGSADEASEILDEDDGASLLPDGIAAGLNGCRHLDPCSSSRCQIMMTESPSLESINCDSGLESMRHDVTHELHRNTSLCQEILSLITKPAAYRNSHQRFRKSLIPISTRYLSSNRCLSVIPQKSDSGTDFQEA